MIEEREIPIVSCPMCFFECELENQLIKHVVHFHKHDSAFRIKCNHYGCGATFRKWKSFKQHIRRNHQDNLQNVDRNVDSPENVGDIFYNNVQNEGQGKDAGKFLIKKLVKLHYVNSVYTRYACIYRYSK